MSGEPEDRPPDYVRFRYFQNLGLDTRVRQLPRAELKHIGPSPQCELSLSIKHQLDQLIHSNWEETFCSIVEDIIERKSVDEVLKLIVLKRVIRIGETGSYCCQLAFKPFVDVLDSGDVDLSVNWLDSADAASDTSRRADLQQAKLENLTVISAMKNRANQITNETRRLDKELGAARSELAARTTQYREAVTARTITGSLPSLRPTGKREVALALCHGRLYQVHAYRTGLADHSVNTDDMIVVNDSLGSTCVKPRPDAGMSVGNGNSFAQKLAKKLDGFDPRYTYVAIAVWDDSFVQFIPLKNALVGLGFEYRLILLKEGEILTESHVPNPLVQ